MSDDVRADARELLDALGDVSWRAVGSGVRNGDHWYVCEDDEAIAMILANDGSDEHLRQPRAEFIAAAPDLVRRYDDALEDAYGQATMAGSALGQRMDESLTAAADRMSDRLGATLELLAQLYRASEYSDSVDEGFLREIGDFLNGGSS
ncbi:hypothetical protein SEA_BOYNAMEDSUE_63 [Gordonia phage BoyNamedSue]|uniref:Uncharacterized protein n=1 Tax=Gordonia phage BoyNamedSue TaxID=2836009 RepID=A0A8F3ILW5_9CAUD|nr:hypothetical protein PP491_gp63 [Gordonia phage BoyNamedSue]QWY79524.1 hypothetical protein SEA_BOYNAMEDSUE_63 [Gordonia phage BoyNamedSue]QYW01089.1 hypothetical protein SEA_ALUME_63 [Gordonia phage AlumE]